MGKDALTDRQVRHMKADSERRIEVPAGPPSGLYLIVHPSGSKAWAFRYRWQGRTRKLTLGAGYPELGLAAARGEAHAALAEIADGRDPAGLREQEDQQSRLEQILVSGVVEEYLKRKVRPEERSWRETERILKRETASWSKRPLSDITKPDVLRLLDSIVDRGASVMANRTRSVLMRFFKWARQRGYIEQSPMIDVGRPGPDHKNRDRVLTPDELVKVWKASLSLGYPYGPFVRILILTAQRRGEVAGMRWRNVDMDDGLWTLPAEATKPGRVHDVPLSSLVLELLRGLPRFEGGDYVFSARGGTMPIGSFSKAKNRLDDAIGDDLPGWTMHDLRRTAATGMAERGVPPQVLAAILNHSPGSVQGVTSIYNRFRYSEERRQALAVWAEHLQNLAVPKRKRNRAG